MKASTAFTWTKQTMTLLLARGIHSPITNRIQCRSLRAYPSFNPGINDLPNITEFINMYLPSGLLQFVVDWTNICAELYFAANPNKDGKDHGVKLRPIDVPVLRKILAYVLNMGLSRKPEIRLYWLRNPMILSPWYRDLGLSLD